MTHTAKINSLEIFAFAQPRKLIPAKMQKFRGFFIPRNFVPAKISSIKVNGFFKSGYILLINKQITCFHGVSLLNFRLKKPFRRQGEYLYDYLNSSHQTNHIKGTNQRRF